ncbi:acyltransferase [Roseitranquillus sediminis]|uniref:acyltransferase n=1 Tax=Roseitranquillus sediminis TaxID=2809051 RepID=UPI001D0C3685|nr:acyltransferase [Roseitranquillus sediminis]MBM9593840.1 acyltransferase [Roseitranquillus sediminis]
MDDAKVYKDDRSRFRRFLRLVFSLLDPRAYAHALKVVNYYNYTHVAELRKATLGRGVQISPTASFANAQNLTIGDRGRIGANTSLWAGPGSGRIVLGEDILIGPGVMLTAASYRFDDGSPVTRQAMDESDIIVGRDVWIGYGAVILPGARIGDRAIVAASAVVRGEVPPGAIVAGVPARVVGHRAEAPAEVSPPAAGP